MQSIPLDAVEAIARQLELLNMVLIAYLCCKGVSFVTATFLRRDPPKKSIRSRLARSDESKSMGHVLDK
jgi:hypothetical protein